MSSPIFGGAGASQSINFLGSFSGGVNLFGLAAASSSNTGTNNAFSSGFGGALASQGQISSAFANAVNNLNRTSKAISSLQDNVNELDDLVKQSKSALKGGEGGDPDLAIASSAQAQIEEAAGLTAEGLAGAISGEAAGVGTGININGFSTEVKDPNLEAIFRDLGKLDLSTESGIEKAQSIVAKAKRSLNKAQKRVRTNTRRLSQTAQLAQERTGSFERAKVSFEASRQELLQRGAAFGGQQVQTPSLERAREIFGV